MVDLNENGTLCPTKLLTEKKPSIDAMKSVLRTGVIC